MEQGKPTRIKQLYMSGTELWATLDVCKTRFKPRHHTTHKQFSGPGWWQRTELLNCRAENMLLIGNEFRKV